jgi:hypothetical protein
MSRSRSLRLRDVFRSSLRLCKLAVVKAFRLPVSLFLWSASYSGRFAFIVKAIPAIMMLIIVAYPWWSFPLWISLSLKVGEPWCYGVYAVWVFQWIPTALFALAVEYLREKNAG